MALLIVMAVLLAVPAGFLIAWLARDELVAGRNYFAILSFASSIIALFSFFAGWMETGFSLLFIGIIAYIAYRKSFDKRWTSSKRNV